MEYDPLVAPNAAQWLSATEEERLSEVVGYHERVGEKLPNARLHAAIHIVIENQLAEGLPDVKKALGRLVAEGLDRHEALHAVGWVLSKHMYQTMKGDVQNFDPNEPYLRDVRMLTAKSWRRQTR
jgi:hypothetical protein